MTNEKMEQKLASALEKTAPDDVSGILSRCEVRKGTVIDMTTKKVRKKKWLPLVAACFAVMLLSGGGLFYQQIHAVASVVSLDVNPSFKLKVNRSEKVLACAPLNEEAKEILADMGYGADLKGAKLDVAVNAIVGSLVRNGYLDSISSAIMISVEDKDTARAEKLQRELTTTVDDVLQTSASRATVLTQTLTEDTEREQQAQKNHISTGKAALVNRVLAINPSLGFVELANLSVERHHSTLVVLALNVCFVLTFHFGTHLFRRFECSIDVTTSRLVTQFVLCIDVSINSATISVHSTCFLIVSVVHLHIVLIVLL